MMYVEFKCECGAMNCSGNPDFDEPKCHTCGLLGSWFPEFEDAIIMPDDPIPTVLDDAIIMPDDPMPPRNTFMNRLLRR